jgi:CubicO group peptidase (beta-lactamase class C family)
LPAPEALHEKLGRIVRRAQAEARLPSLNAAVFRDGKVIWSEAIGLADIEAGEPATADHQYGIASITKTFVATSIMQLRDAGELDLDDPLSRHVPEAAHGSPTLRRMLSHLSGLQREVPGEVWESLELPTRDEVFERLEQAEQVLAPALDWHYSNLAYVLLGEVLERRSGVPVKQYVEERLLQPLGLSRTSWEAQGPTARPYFVEPYSDAVRPEPQLDQRGASAAGGLWSTLEDLASWGSFLVDPDPAVLAPETAKEMRSVQVMANPEWTLGWGLGLELFRTGERILVGHTGGLPGYISVLKTSPDQRVGIVVLTNGSSWPTAQEVAFELATAALDELPREPEEWRAEERPPEEVAPLLGRWWSESAEFVFSWHRRRLEARLAHGPPEREPAVFAPEGADVWRTVSGRERGELLRAVRDEAGDVVKLYWATYPFTRSAEPFGATAEQREPARGS